MRSNERGREGNKKGRVRRRRRRRKNKGFQDIGQQLLFNGTGFFNRDFGAKLFNSRLIGRKRRKRRF
jgi:hypothetical protein